MVPKRRPITGCVVLVAFDFKVDVVRLFIVVVVVVRCCW